MGKPPAEMLLAHLRQALRGGAGEGSSDAELLRRFAHGQDADAFELLVWRHQRLVLGVCRRVLGDPEDAEDAFQATFLTLARKAASVGRRGAVAGWLYRVAYRVALNARARVARRAARERQGVDLTEVPAPGGPEQEVGRREIRSALDREVSRLPEKYRAPVVLCYLEGKTYQEAGRQLGLPLGTVSARLTRARERLRARLLRRGLGVSGAALATLLCERAAAAAAPGALVRATTRAANTALSRGAAAGLISPRVAALADAALPRVGPGKVVAATALVLVVTLVASALGLRSAGPRALKEAGPPADQRAAPAPRTDRFGDPLPAEAVARVGTYRFRHGGFVRSLGFGQGGKAILSDGLGGTRVWSAATGKELLHVGGREQRRAWFACHSADGSRVATFDEVGPDGRIRKAAVRVWDATTGEKVSEFGAGGYELACLSPDGKALAAVDFDSLLTLWDADRGRPLRSWRAHDGRTRCATFSHDGKVLVTAGADETVCFWDVATGRKLRELTGLLAALPALALSPDGALLACVAHKRPPGQAVGELPENRVRLWDVAGAKEIRQLVVPGKGPAAGALPGFRAVAFSPDGKWLATSGVDAHLRVWSPATGKEERRIAAGAVPPAHLAFSPDGKALAACNDAGTIRLFDVSSGREIRPAGGPRDEVRAAVLTPDGRTVVTLAGDGGVVCWGADTGRALRELGGGFALSLDVSADGRLLYSAGADRKLRVWDLATGQEVRRLPTDGLKRWPPLAAVAPGGKLLALLADQRSVVLADAETGEEVRRLVGRPSMAPEERGVRGAAFTADGRTLAVWGDQKAHVWDVGSGKELREVPCQDGPLAPGSYYGYAAALSPDGALIAFGSPNGFLALRELATGKEVRRIDGLPGGVAVAAFAPDGRALAWGGRQDARVHLLEVAGGGERHLLSGHRGGITALSFSADGRRLVSASADGTALVWGLTGQLAPAGGAPAAGELEACWSDLAGDDAARAYRAVRRLAASPAGAAFLRKRLPPAAPPDAERLGRLLADLNSDQFAVRDRAAKELEKLGEAAVPACRRLLAGDPPAEVRRRVTAFLERQSRERWEPLPERLRAVRALEALEAAGTPEAREALKALAGGEPGAWLTREAAAALRRLGRRP